jgi:hypothetical protein
MRGRRVRAPMLAEKPAQGIPEHFSDVVARKLTEIHGRSYARPNFGLRFSLNDMVASL